MLDFFDKDFVKPESCVEADPNLPYCQLIGDYQIDITKEYSILTPYSDMNETCPTMPEDYNRPRGC